MFMMGDLLHCFETYVSVLLRSIREPGDLVVACMLAALACGLLVSGTMGWCLGVTRWLTLVRKSDIERYEGISIIYRPSSS